METPSLSTSHLVIMLGVPGAGKSFFAEHFAETFSAPIISYDRLHKELNLCEIDQKTENSVISHVLKYMFEEISKTKRTIIFDGRIYSRASCEELTKIAHKLGYKPLFILVQTDLNTAKHRIIKANHNNAASITSEQFDKIASQFNPIDRAKANVIAISGRHAYQTQLKIVLRYLSESH